MKNIIKRLIFISAFLLVAVEHQFRHQASENVRMNFKMHRF